MSLRRFWVGLVRWRFPPGAAWQIRKAEPPYDDALCPGVPTTTDTVAFFHSVPERTPAEPAEMKEVAQICPRQRRKPQTPQASVVVEGDLCDHVVFRNLVNDWIVSRLVDDWIKQIAYTEFLDRR